MAASAQLRPDSRSSETIAMKMSDRAAHPASPASSNAAAASVIHPIAVSASPACRAKKPLSQSSFAESKRGSALATHAVAFAARSPLNQ